MLTLIITEKGHEPTTQQFEEQEITIGRLKTNELVLAKNNISKQHARIIQDGDAIQIVDLKSTNGTYVNGKKIEGPQELSPGDKIYIGNFTMELEEEPPPPPPMEDEHAPHKEEVSSTWDVEDVDMGDDEWDDEWENDSAEEQAEDDFQLEELLDKSGEPAEEPPKTPTGKPKVNDQELSSMLEASDAPIDEDVAESEEPPTPPMEEEAPVEKTPVEEAATKEPAAETKSTKKKKAEKKEPSKTPPKVSSKKTAPQKALQGQQLYMEILAEVHKRLINSLDLRRLDVESMNDEELRERSQGAIEEIVESMQAAGELPAEVDASLLIDDVLNEALGLGPLEEFIQDESVTEIMVNGAENIYIERDGRLEPTDACFSSNSAVLGVIERIVAPIGRRIDESSPMVDARLKDGSRVNAIIPPLAVHGPTLTIRKFTSEPLTIDDLVVFASLTPEMAHFLEICVIARKNIIISGGTGSGKTTTLNVLSGYIPEVERILTIEDAAELKLSQQHIVSLESRPPNIEGKGQIGIRELVRNALRMRPDRIVVGECRGGEALDMLQAMNTGHDGSLTTLHANSPRDCLARLETMVLMSGMELPIKAIRDQISSAADIIVQQTRFPDGSRRITHITEVTGIEGDIITMQDIFTFNQEGFDEEGMIVGQHKPTGFVPTFYETLAQRGIKADFSIFEPEKG